MIEVIIVCEGQTEETFVNRVLAPELWRNDVSATPRLIRTSSSGRGGALSRERVLRYVHNTLRERDDTYVATFFDLYGLAPDFPGVDESKSTHDPILRAAAIERYLAEAVVRKSRIRSDRLVPHIQPYEFESLLFAGIDLWPVTESGWASQLALFIQARKAAVSPEHINDGQRTHPSKRMQALKNAKYQKVFHGSQLAETIGIERMRAECAHFAGWLEKLERLSPL